MKKIILSSLVATTFALGSCGGSKEAEEKKGPDLCTCVNEKWENDEEEKACKLMEEEWKDKFQKADEAEQKKLMEEIEACQGK